MIEVRVTVVPESSSNESVDLAHIRIYNRMTIPDPEEGNYSAEIGVNHGESFGVYVRQISGFPRRKFNALALVKLVLDQLTEEEFDLDTDRPADMARKQRKGGYALQRWAGKLHHH